MVNKFINNNINNQKNVLKRFHSIVYSNIFKKAAADYFERIINYVYNEKSERPVAPWKC